MRVKDWHKFQHYQDGKRKPDWIKLYRGLLDDVDFDALDGAAAKVLVKVWLVASESGGELPDLRKLAFRLRLSEKETKSILSKLSHWLEHDASDALADCYQSDSPEEEREEEENKKEKENKKRASARIILSPRDELLTVLDAERAEGVIQHRQRIGKALTPRAARLLAEEFSRAPNPNAAADEMLARGWQGFKVEWLSGRGTGPPHAKTFYADDVCAQIEQEAYERNNKI